MNKQLRHAMTALALVATAGAAHADIVDITFSGIADFSIGEQTFDDAAFTVSTTADTANLIRTTVPSTPMRAFQYQGLPGSLYVDGLGDGTFDYKIAVFSNPLGQAAGLMASVDFIPFHQGFAGVDMFGFKSPLLATYELKSDLILEGVETYDPQQWFEVDTSFGKLTATNFESLKMQVVVTAVPEGSSAALFALGACFLLGAKVRASRRG